MKKLLCLFLSSLILFQGCVIPTNLGTTVNNCETADCILINFGPPTNVVDNGDFGEIWIYKGDDTPFQGEKKKLMKFYINNDNIVYKRELPNNKQYNPAINTVAVILFLRYVLMADSYTND